ncbi:MAG: hypothetical protein OXE99_04605, partial [Cellvibrionales bacterium]|nr:hypothetical protein [Cellvibrionales bacterium]
ADVFDGPSVSNERDVQDNYCEVDSVSSPRVLNDSAMHDSAMHDSADVFDGPRVSNERDGHYSEVDSVSSPRVPRHNFLDFSNGPRVANDCPGFSMRGHDGSRTLQHDGSRTLQHDGREANKSARSTQFLDGVRRVGVMPSNKTINFTIKYQSHPLKELYDNDAAFKKCIKEKAFQATFYKNYFCFVDGKKAYDAIDEKKPYPNTQIDPDIFESQLFISED